MRCHYLSDLHLESQDFPWVLPTGEVLIVAGDVCNARCLSEVPHDRYALVQRDRVLRFFDQARANFQRIIMVSGNHEHYDGVFDDTCRILADGLPGIDVLDNAYIDIDGVRFFGSTLWSDFEGRSRDCMDGVRRRIGDFFLVKKKSQQEDDALQKFQPEDALAAHENALLALQACVSETERPPVVVVTHHAPALKSLNPVFQGNGLDGAYASDLADYIEALNQVPFWVHGHTHVQRNYRIAATQVVANCRGFDGKERSATAFAPDRYFEL